MKNFYFGVATSAYQNEGGNICNWKRWERLNHLEPCGNACDMWNNFEEDVKLLKNLGVNMFRFSIEWSRVEPQPNRFNEEVILRYKSWVELLLANGITPVITLSHFTLPIWVDERGGWGNRDIPALFMNYVSKVINTISNKYWITLNEPVLECIHGWLHGTRPPGNDMDVKGCLNALNNMCMAHAMAYRCIKTTQPNSLVSIAKNVAYFSVEKWYRPLDYVTKRQIEKLYNYSFLDALVTGHVKFKLMNVSIDSNYIFMKDTLDFIGMNHYNRIYIGYNFCTTPNVSITMSRKNSKQNSMGWELHPKSMYYCLKKIYKKYKLPILITENGSCGDDTHNNYRIDYLTACINYLKKARREGVYVFGYNAWTLYDNFEWDDGYGPKFGLFSNNFETQERRITLCGEIYKNIIKTSQTF